MTARIKPGFDITEESMVSASRKMRRGAGKMRSSAKRTFTEDEAYEHAQGYAPPIGIADLKDSISDFLQDPQNNPPPSVVVDEWRQCGFTTTEIIDKLIRIFSYTENMAFNMLDALAPGANIVMLEELYDLVPDQNDEQAVSVRNQLLSSDVGRLCMRPNVWGWSREHVERLEKQKTDQQRKIDTAAYALERVRIWPQLRVRRDFGDAAMRAIDAEFVFRNIQPVWDPVTQSTNRNQDLANYSDDVEDADLVEDMPKREDRLEEVLRLRSIETRSLSEVAYRAMTLAYTTLEQQELGLGEAYIMELTGQSYADLTGHTKIHLVKDHAPSDA